MFLEVRTGIILAGEGAGVMTEKEHAAGLLGRLPTVTEKHFTQVWDWALTPSLELPSPSHPYWGPGPLGSQPPICPLPPHASRLVTAS